MLAVAAKAEQAVENLFRLPSSLQELANLLTNMFPLWIATSVLLGLYCPSTVMWLQGHGVTACVGATMVFTGMTLETRDFLRILQKPMQVLLGCACQYLLMPLAAWVISKSMGLPKDIAAGVILLGACPGGTSSNLITLIAKGDVALSVLMTLTSTMMASILTPAIVGYLAGNLVEIDSAGLVKSTLAVVLGPVAVGLLLNKLFPRACDVAQKVTPLICVVLVSLICGSIIGQTAAEIKGRQGLVVFLSVTLLHASGFLFGYSVPNLLGYSPRVCRTTAIETGIQSSALAVVLASRHFPDPILTALPGALSAPAQSVLGSLIAMYWYMQKDC